MSAVPWSMPPEWAEHERTLIAWPSRAELWGDQLGRAKDCHARVVAAVARFEPVMLVANIGDGDEAATATEGDHAHAVDVVEEPMNDSWLRDTGPIVLQWDNDKRIASDFRFNGWGGKYEPFDDDAVAARLAARLGIPSQSISMVLEGGAITVDGAGTLVTTEQCLMHPTRNPKMGRLAIEETLEMFLGAERVVWLERGLVEDRDTDGHVDNVCAFIAPGVALVQGTADRNNPNADLLADNRRRLEEAGIKTISVDVLPYDIVGGREVVVPPLNLYFVNGSVLVPVADNDPDAAEAAVECIAAAIPDREVVPIAASVLAYGGGGIHCITQQIPG
ncbi:MAG: agmatine deiminase family protein [Acidimicrobiia bacterium]|nr:agmatine deiminase family protein [Acidimicrobiia bacterium]